MKIGKLNKSYFFLLLVILMIGAALRFISLERECLWADEVLTYERAKLPILELFKIETLNINPPLYPAVINLWGRLFNLSVASLRGFSALMGIMGIYLMFIAGRIIFGQKTALCASLLLAISPMHIYFSQEARAYSMLMSIVIFTFFATTKLITEPEKLANFILLVIAHLLLIYTHYAAISIISTQIAILVIFGNKKIWKQLTRYFLIMLLMISPWTGTLLSQIKLVPQNWHSSGTPSFMKLVGFMKEFGGSSYLTAILLWLAFIFTLVQLFSYLAKNGCKNNLFSRSRNTEKMLKLMLIFCTISPLIVLVICAQWFGVPFKLRYAVVGLPSFLLLASYGIIRLARFGILIFCLVFLIIVATSPLIYEYYHENHNTDWRPLVKFLKRYWVPQETKLLVNLKDDGKVLRYYTGDFIDSREFPEFSFYRSRRTYPNFAQLEYLPKNIKCVICLDDRYRFNPEEEQRRKVSLSSLFPNTYSFSIGAGVRLTFYCIQSMSFHESVKDFSIIPPEKLIWK